MFIFCLPIINANPPATEIRAVWLTTMWNLDWPSPNLSVEGQKDQLRQKLDKLQEANFNTVFFQTRLRGDVFYNSKIEPLSPHAKSGFDPLAFAIEECHKRGMDCHAWFVTFPIGSKKQVAAHGKNSVVKKYPEICKLYNGEWYLDPGNPQTIKYLLSIVDEIVRNYDVDGIHFDYIRYPEKSNKFPDKQTYTQYGKGLAISDWRRENINRLVSDIYDQVKEIKPWVQVSSSPLGKYKDLSYGGSDGWSAYESVFQDVGQWVKAGKQDAIYPMMYYKERLFYPYLNDWLVNCNDRFIVPGLGAYRMAQQEGNWSLKDITDQIDYTRAKDTYGQAYFRTENILNDLKGIDSTLRAQYYQFPAKQPPMIWLDNEAPNSPLDFEVSRNADGKLCLQWQTENPSEEQTYTVYCSDSENIDTKDAKNIVATSVRRNRIELNVDYGDYGLYYAVSASDRFHNEGITCFPAFYVHSLYEK